MTKLMRKAIIALGCLSLFLLTACGEEFIDTKADLKFDNNFGEVEIDFNYRITGAPIKKIRRAGLSFAYTADSALRSQFFTSVNVSDSVSRYSIQLKPGVYYYIASIVCTCGGDSCLYAGFLGQNTLRQSSSKFQITKGLKTTLHTQFQ